jgi:hypothetical protein
MFAEQYNITMWFFELFISDWAIASPNERIVLREICNDEYAFRRWCEHRLNFLFPEVSNTLSIAIRNSVYWIELRNNLIQRIAAE